jgi:hypothetical protein
MLRAWRIPVSLALLLSLTGGHWWMLQTIAWSRMIVNYSARSGLVQGIEETFDGDHPCPMCLAIKQARAAEDAQAPSMVASEKSAEVMGLPPETGWFATTPAFLFLTGADEYADPLRAPPLLTPPRSSRA